MQRTAGFILACLLLIFATGTSRAAERITFFDSTIEIDAHGVLLVKETITVTAEGDKIRRGIYRDFPTVRGKTWLGAFKTSFDVISVTRDGVPEKWRTQRITDGVRLYIGDADKLLARGRHTYGVTYKTDRQIGFFPDHDELYWNVTGNFWSFPIESVAGIVRLPPKARPKDFASYSGAVGEKETKFQIPRALNAVAFFHSRPLQPGEGLTIVVTWDKGFVALPNAAQKIAYAARDNAGLLAALTSLLLVAAYYLLTWWHYGRDPERGTVIPEYDPPRGLSPAACRYVLHMDWDDKAFTSTVMHMAARGFLRMAKLSDGVFTLTKTGASEKACELSAGERTIARRLFSGSWTSIALRPQQHKEIREATFALRKALEQEHDHIHLLHNRGMLTTGFLLSAASLVVTAGLSPERIGDMLLGVLLGVLALFVYTAVKRGSAFVRDATATIKSFILVVIGGLIASIILALRSVRRTNALQESFDEAKQSLMSMSIDGADVSITLAVLAIAIINLIFFEIMKAPTGRGRKLMDQIEGFKHYLTVAEKDRLNFHNPPDLTPTRFEAYLPFAVALDVENDWGEQFHGAMNRAARAQGTTWDDKDYAPSWYDGSTGSSWFRSGPSWNDVSKSFGASVSAASIAPSEKSGFGSGLGGGGFSGGGGGGGGGGGW